MVEKELKVLLSSEQYEKVKRMFKWDKVVKQRNYYYVEMKSINYNITIRVRDVAGKYKLQVKIPIKKEQALHIKKEYECNLDLLPDFINSNFLNDKFDFNMPDGIFTCVGCLQTERNIFKLENGTEVCLDKNKYLDCIDYELEIEYDTEKPDGLLRLINSAGITFEQEVCGKNTRFLQKYLKNSTCEML